MRPTWVGLKRSEEMSQVLTQVNLKLGHERPEIAG
jgi:hypothetical protein